MKKTKIAFCLRDMRIGGAEACLIRTLDELRRDKNLELSVITYARIQEPLYLEWFAAHPDVTVRALYPCRWLGTKLARFFLWRVGQHLMRDVYRWFKRVTMNVHQFDDVDVFIDYYEFGFAREMRRFHQPKITWWHSSINKFINGKYIRYMPEYDRMVVLTGGFRDEFCALYPDFCNSVVRIYNPVDIADIRARAAAAPKCEFHDYFVSVARMQADKDIETILRGFDKFWQKNNRPDVQLVLVGGGGLLEHFRAMAYALPAGKNITFVGAQSNPFGYMAGARANILSSFSEGLPTVLIEGAIVGTTNVSSDCKNGPREILMDGAGGILFTPGNADELAAAMDAVYNNRVDVKKMQDVADENLCRFDASSVATEIKNMIKKISDK